LSGYKHHWYALHTKPHAETQVAAVLDGRGIEVYLPLVKRQWRGQMRERPFFPNYLFARFSLDEVGHSAIAWTPGLRSLVTFDSRPATVPDEAVALVRQELQKITGQGGLPSHGFQPGDELRFASGPLQGLYAVFEGPLTPSERVRVLIQFLGQANRAEVPVSDLEPVREPDSKGFRERRSRGRGRPLRRGSGSAGEHQSTSRPARRGAQ